MSKRPGTFGPPIVVRPGDAVRLDSRGYWGAKPGMVGIIDSVEPRTRTAMVVFSPRAFRGTSNRPGDPGALDLKVSVSGGPCPFVNVDELSPAGTALATFWHWNGLPRYGNDETYELEVPLWSWTPLVE